MIRRVKVYFAGGCEPGPIGGAMAFSFAVHVDNVQVHAWTGFEDEDPDNSVAAANFRAIHESLCYLTAHDYLGDQVRVYGDDMNAVNIMTGRWKAKGPIQNAAAMVRQMTDRFKDIGFTALGRLENEPMKKSIADKFKAHGIEPRRREAQQA